MLVSRLLARPPLSPAHTVRAASFPPKTATRPRALADPDAAVDPVLFLHLRQRIIERHNPSGVELDEPHVQLVNKNIFDIRRGLEKRDITLLRQSWAELRKANHLSILTRDVVEQIARLATTSLLPTQPRSEKWGLNRRSFVEEVALAAAAMHSTNALNACLIAYLRRGDSKAVLELYEKYQQQLPDTQDAPDDADDADDNVDLVAPEKETHPGRVKAFLAAVAAHAMEDSFQGALKTYLGNHTITLRLPTTEQFLWTISHDPALQNKVRLFVRRLDLAKFVSRPRSISKHIDNLSKKNHSPVSVIEQLYNSILEAMTEPDAFLAADASLVTSTKLVAMSELVWGSFLVAFLRYQRNDLAAQLWKDVTHFGVQPGLLTWNMVLNVYKDRGSIKEVLGGWTTMKAHGVEPDAFTYCILLSSLFAAKRLSEALRWFQTFETEVKPTTSVEGSLSVYNADEGPKPDIISYNTMLGYHGSQVDFKGMAVIINNMSEAGVAGDVFTFSTILSALLKAGRTDAPEMVMSIMRNQGVLANVATYSAIIVAQMRERSIPHLHLAMRLLDEMERTPEVTPNEITYTSILAELYRGTWLSADEAKLYREDIVARMKKRNVKFKSAGYNIVIKACLTSEAPTGLEDALGFYRQMVRDNTQATNSTWYILLAGLIGRGEWQVAEEIVKDMFSSGADPKDNVLRLVNKIRQGQR
ncbi:hypothetical protein C8R44DRAFT_816126 [Mycena epipterygia]|nr:hypothetical protein C8R44DRAFT_816126 [Mycena epipterygia]